MERLAQIFTTGPGGAGLPTEVCGTPKPELFASLQEGPILFFSCFETAYYFLKLRSEFNRY